MIPFIVFQGRLQVRLSWLEMSLLSPEGLEQEALEGHFQPQPFHDPVIPTGIIMTIHCDAG